MRLSLVLAAAVVLTAPAALAQPVSVIDDGAGVSHDGRKFKDKDGRICKRMVITGSRMPQKKVCKTAEQWRLQEEEAKKELGDQIRRSGTTNRVGGTSGG
ncbi:MAG TPA: hypothetical protein VEA44_04385 [Caulobacter sp.]|nr:hypothetical protein [Caulobacter sp.]